SRVGTPTDNPIIEALNGWIKEELRIDFDIYHCNDVPTLIKNYISYYNTERPSVKCGRKSPVQFRTEQGFPN
ncbi:MAG: integrase core domain-containing protein, partial [Eubacterium sp.]|nr:integrase core domain-containing protein [Eubacterium sp.]